jgi:Ca2+-binding EF-hand superfamily protein
MENEKSMDDLIIPEEGLLKKELQDEIEARIYATVENLYTLDVELETFVQLVKESVEDNKNSPENLQTLFNYLDEMWGVVITNELRDVLIDSLCVVQESKDELEDVLDELEDSLNK